jgi:hypothetical protein
MEQKHRLCPRRKQTNDPKSDFHMCSQTRARGDMALRPKHRIDWPNNIGGDRANPVRFTQLFENVCAEATHKTYETRTRALHQACRQNGKHEQRTAPLAIDHNLKDSIRNVLACMPILDIQELGCMDSFAACAIDETRKICLHQITACAPRLSRARRRGVDAKTSYLAK